MQNADDDSQHRGDETAPPLQLGNLVFERNCKAAIAGAAVPIAVGVVAIITSLCKGSFSLEVWGAAIEFTVITVLPGAVAGMIGAAVRGSGMAGLYGAVLFLCVAGQYIWFTGWQTKPFSTSAWLLVLASVIGWLSGDGGAVVARTVANSDHRPSSLMSKREMIVASCLVAVLWGCIYWIV